MRITYDSANRMVSVECDGQCIWYTVWHLARLGIVSDYVLGLALTQPDTVVEGGAS